MKKTKTLKEYVKNLKEKREELPFHKMDDKGRRQFIQGVGMFLGGLMVPTMIRLETMSKLSKKIFGNSLAYAADETAKRPIVIRLMLRRGFATPWMGVGFAGHEAVTDTGVNLPWVSSNVNSDPDPSYMPVILGGPLRTELATFRDGIQLVVGTNAGGNHTAFFPSDFKAGKGELIALTAATQVAQGSSAIIGSPFVFGDPTLVGVNQSLPTSIAAHTPVVLANVSSASTMCSPPDFKTTNNTDISQSLQDQILQSINNKFLDDITASLLTKDKEAITASAEQAFNILKENNANALNPNFSGNSSRITSLRNSLVASEQKGKGVDILNNMFLPDILFTLIQAQNLGITPKIGGCIINNGDWHTSVNPASGDGSGDDRYETGTYIGRAMLNVLKTASTSGTKWVNPITGEDEEVWVMLTSEFSRTVRVTDSGTPNSNNQDGETISVLTMSSNANTTYFKPGSLGGIEEIGPVGDKTAVVAAFDPRTKVISRSNTLFSPDRLFALQRDLLAIDSEKYGLTGYTGIPEILG